MASKKPVSKKKSEQKSNAKHNAAVAPPLQSLRSKIRLVREEYLSRRPHRSFRRTRRRDYARSLALPGYISFTLSVFMTLKNQSKTFALLIIIASLSTGLLSGMASQDTFASLSETLQATSKDIFEGTSGSIQKAGLLTFTVVTGGISVQATEAQQIFGALVAVLVWLATVWLLRAQLAGNSPKLRDALYNSGTPLVSSLIVFTLFLAQLIPAAIAIIGYSAAVSTDFISVGVVSMLLAIVGALLVVLSLYLTTTTFFALVIITLPGMYPWQALRTAGDLVIGRRLRLLYRLLWMLLVVALLWVVILVPIVLAASWLQTTWQQIAAVPIVPLALLIMSTASSVFVASYVYLLYRKVVEDDALPA